MRDRPAKLSDGFHVVASDLDRAISLAGFWRDELIVLQQARELSWVPGLVDGSRQPRAFRIRFESLSQALGINRQSLSRAFHRLVNCAVILEVGDRAYAINKDLRHWRKIDGSPRFTTGELQWVASAGIGTASGETLFAIAAPGAAKTKRPALRNGEADLENAAPGAAKTKRLALLCKKPHSSAGAAFFDEDSSGETHVDIAASETQTTTSGTGAQNASARAFRKKIDKDPSNLPRGEAGRFSHPRRRRRRRSDPIDYDAFEDFIRECELERRKRGE